MATANTKSTIVSTLDELNGAKRVSGLLMGGRVREQIGKCEVAAADDNNSIYRFARVHSSWRIVELLIWNDAITSGADFNVGLWDTAQNGGAVVNENLFGDAITMVSARATSGPLNALAEALNIDDLHKPIWELLALSADPNKFYDLAMIGIAVGSGAGGITVQVRYVDGS